MKLNLDTRVFGIRSNFRNVLNNFRITPSTKVAVACSGGKDSVGLLLLALDFFNGNENNLSIIHINHGLRDLESRKEEEFVESLAQRFGISWSTYRLSPPNKFPKGIEEWASSERYKIFHEFNGFVLTAHTMEDNTETILSSVLRGSINPTNGIGFKRINVIRPVLKSTHCDLEYVLRRERIGWCEDSSNNSLDYTRNKIRKIILPLVREHINPGVDKTLIKFKQIER